MSIAEDELAALKAALIKKTGLYGMETIETSVGAFVYVKSQERDRRRWYTNIDEVYKSPSGLFFVCPWQRGHTESQEHEYAPEDTCEVEPYDTVVTNYIRKKKPNG